MPSFGQFLKVEREKRQWTQKEFGDRIGLNTSAVSRIENDSQKFGKTKLKVLSELFEKDEQSVRDLFFADKFAKEAFKYKCSDNIFSIAETNIKHIKQTKTIQGQLDI